MKRWRILLFLWPAVLLGHIGSPVVVADGFAGPYPLRVVVRPPAVIPGRAQIDVRLLRPVAAGTQVLVLPVTAGLGLKGAPRPDETTGVQGDPSLRHGELWLMTFGSYSVHVTVRGSEGEGTFIVPVDAVATQILPLPTWTKVSLGLLGVLLFAGAISLMAAAAQEATAEPGDPISRRDRWRGLLVGLGALVGFGFLLFAGKSWWDRADEWHRANEIYHPLPLTTEVSHVASKQRVLNLVIDASGLYHNEPVKPLPDHGKLMHLFLMREPALDVFAHLHPIQERPDHFAVTLPPLPAGNYTLYADVTSEWGFAETLTTKLSLKSGEAEAESTNEAEIAPVVDPDDAWFSSDSSSSTLPREAQLQRTAVTPLRAGEPLSLEFRAVDAQGNAVESEPYMGMLGHAAIRKVDGTVFAHLHPLGTISMASQNFFAQQADQQTKGAVKARPELCEAGINVTFPYEFPSSGAYRIWVQTRVKGEIITGAFDLDVLPSK